MAFFRAYHAKTTTTSTYFIESTAPENVDDEAPPPPLPAEYAADLDPVNSDLAVEQIAAVLCKGEHPTLVVMVHGFNNPQPDVLKMYTSAALAIGNDPSISGRDGLVCVGYRWPSEKMGQPRRGTWTALPMLPTRILYLAIILSILPFLVHYLALESGDRWAQRILDFLRNSILDHVVTLSGLTFGGLVLTAALLRVIVYFRDNYRASNYGIPDLIQVIRAIDSRVKELRDRQGGHHRRPVALSFIGHSMGGFVVTNTIRTLSNVFSTSVGLNEFGTAGALPDSGSQNIGHVFQLKRFVLASPDIPAEALLSSRGNFLASTLSRFEEAYLFSSEGDEVLRQISTLANYFVFPTRSQDYGFRLGNVEILSSEFGPVNPAAYGGFLRTLRVGNLTLHELSKRLDNAEARRKREDQTNKGEGDHPEKSLPQVFTYFDCTDYVDEDLSGKTRPLLTFAKWLKRHNRMKKMPFRSHMYLLAAYLLPGHRPNVHGGYFEGKLSQRLIYRLACLGFDDTVAAFGGQPALEKECTDKQIRMLRSPALDEHREHRNRPAAAILRERRTRANKL